MESVRAESKGVETDRSSGTRRGMGPSTFTQIVEITSGRAIFQQGLTATCKDLPYKETEIGKEEFGLSHEPVRAMKEG